MGGIARGGGRVLRVRRGRRAGRRSHGALPAGARWRGPVPRAGRRQVSAGLDGAPRPRPRRPGGAGPGRAARHRPRGGAVRRAARDPPLVASGHQAGRVAAATFVSRPALGRRGVIADDPRVVLRVRLDPSPPPASELAMHWRARALESWTGRGWRSRGEGWVGGRLPPLPPLRASALRPGKRSLLTAEIEA